MMEITSDQIRKLNDKFLGKKVILRTEGGKRYVGIAEFIGINQFLPEWGLQFTLSRMPIDHVDQRTVELFDPENPKHKA